MNVEMLKDQILVVIRVRGRRSMKPKIARTLELLKLNRTNHAVVYKATMPVIGMLKVAKDYITFGRISKATLEALIAKRGEKGSKKASEVVKPKEVAEAVFAGKKLGDFIDPVFRLAPPRKGWKSVKKPEQLMPASGDADVIVKRMM